MINRLQETNQPVAVQETTEHAGSSWDDLTKFAKMEAWRLRLMPTQLCPLPARYGGSVFADCQPATRTRNQPQLNAK